MNQEKTTIVEHRSYQGDYRILRVAAPVIGPQVQPGQFVHLRIPRFEQAVLRRPFSVFKADEEGLSILYATVGAGTAALNAVQPGETLDLLGPLGNGFPPLEEGKTLPVLVAGGYGNAALYLQAKILPFKGVAFFGGRSAKDILCVDEFEALGWEVHIATDDGSLGTKGLVTAALDPWLEEQGAGVRGQRTEDRGQRAEGRGQRPEARGQRTEARGQRTEVSQAKRFQTLEIFACGPNGMLKAVGERALARGIPAWLSMDRNMACGVGACLTCVIKRKTATGWEWARCCKDGPVFEASEILWEE